MKKQERKDLLFRHYDRYKDDFNKILDFIIENKKYRKDYNYNYCNKFISGCKYAKERIRSLFVNSINAAGGNNLRLTGEACENFFKKVDKLPNKNLIDFKEFLSIFNVTNINNLYAHLSDSEEFPNFKNKKTALFIRDLDIVNKKLFKNYNINKNDLQIPVDVVIVTIINKILHLNGKKKKLNSMRDFDLVNKFAHEISPKNHMVIEDFWFWGYFNLGKKRNIEFNKEKYYSDLFNYPNEKLKEKLSDFRDLIITKKR